jgi:hypothetical protein
MGGRSVGTFGDQELPPNSGLPDQFQHPVWKRTHGIRVGVVRASEECSRRVQVGVVRGHSWSLNWWHEGRNWPQLVPQGSQLVL